MSQTVANGKDDVPSPGVAKDRHPPGLYILFGSEMWERYGFYTAAAVMTLYLQRGGFGWSKTQASTLWSYYMMFIYATPLIGGWLADKVLGYRRAVIIGGLFFIGGYTLLAQGSPPMLYVALGLLITGNGFFKPNISTMVGNLYPANSPLKDSAYNIFYMGINIGALLGPMLAEVALQALAGPGVLEMAKKGTTLSTEQAASLRSGFLAAFYLAAGGMTIGTLMVAFFYRKLAATDLLQTRPMPRTPRPSQSPRISHRPRKVPRRSTRCRSPSGSPRSWSSTASSSSSGWCSTRTAAR